MGIDLRFDPILKGLVIRDALHSLCFLLTVNSIEDFFKSAYVLRVNFIHGLLLARYTLRLAGVVSLSLVLALYLIWYLVVYFKILWH